MKKKEWIKLNEIKEILNNDQENKPHWDERKKSNEVIERKKERKKENGNENKENKE